MDQTYDSGQFEQVLDQGLALADWNGFDARRARESRQRGKLRGRGIATFLEWTGGNVFEERVTVDGRGRRHHRDLLGDAGDGAGHRDHATRSSRSTCSACRSTRSASCRATPTAATASAAPARARCSPAARRCGSAPSARSTSAKELGGEGARSRAGRHRIPRRAASASPAPTVGIDLFELAGTQPEQRIFVDSTSTVGGPTWPNGCHVCEVEIDPDTGDVEVVATRRSTTSAASSTR